MPKANEPLLFLITGGRGAGKTTFCERMVFSAREAGWQVAGLLSRPVFEEGQPASPSRFRTAIEAVDLRTGCTRQLAARSDDPTPGTKHWKFDPSAVEWGNQVLRASVPCDLLIVDELGPLEFERDQGWQAGLIAVDSRQYAIAFVVVRAELLGEALTRWPEVNLVEIEMPEDSAYKASILAGQLF
jgi:nucleoside-triphosphatase